MSKAKLQEDLQEFRDQAEAAETVEELRELVKGLSDTIEDATTPAAATGKRVQRDDDDEEDDEDDTDPEDDDDLDDEDDEDDDVPAAPRGRAMTKSLNDAVDEVGGDVLDAEPVLGAVSEGLIENNRQNLQNFEVLQALNNTLKKSLNAIEKFDRRLEVIEDELAAQHSMVKSASDFVNGVRKLPAGTPTAATGVLASPAAFLSKSLPGASAVDLRATDEEQTLRGLNEKQLIKGLQIHLDETRGEQSGLDINDLVNIGRVPMGQLNPKIAEVAAEALKIELKD